MLDNKKSPEIFIDKWRPTMKAPHYKTRYINGTLRLKSPRSIRPPHHGHTSQSWSWMDDSHPFRFMSIGHPIPEIRLFQTQTLKLQGQGHGCGQRAKSYSQPSILLIRFPFISHQSDQQFLRYKYFDIWPWNIQGQGHEGAQRSSTHIIPSIQTMHFLFCFTSMGPTIPEIWSK